LPLIHFVGLVCGSGEPDESVGRFGDAGLALRREFGLLFLPALVTGEQQRFGVGVLLLA
jgi:hypothetical protein